MASPAQLASGLAAFFAMHNKPELSTPVKVASILASFAGREAALYARLKKKYREGPDILLLAPGQLIVDCLFILPLTTFHANPAQQLDSLFVPPEHILLYLTSNKRRARRSEEESVEARGME